MTEVGSKRKVSVAHKRYMLRFWPFMILYMVAVAGISGWFGWTPDFTGAAGAALAVLPALPVGGVLWAMGRYLDEEHDEFVRLKQARAMLLAVGLTMFVCTAWGFMSEYAGVAPLPLFLVFPLFCFFWAPALGYVSWRFR